ncbi:hypothetical protein C8Q80DRAFT_609546 [Daedaleopsis nitida]|nr:hypothetical protein C8Q80DRAFT_609546 [Daedaleopsis nitida]
MQVRLILTRLANLPLTIVMPQTTTTPPSPVHESPFICSERIMLQEMPPLSVDEDTDSIKPSQATRSSKTPRRSLT